MFVTCYSVTARRRLARNTGIQPISTLMAARRRGPRHAEAISASGVTGQKGINLIERIVLDMESRWTPSGPNEVGIDGYVELQIPPRGKPWG